MHFIGYLIIAAVVALFVWSMCKAAGKSTPSPDGYDNDGEDYCLATHAVEGQWRVLYNDGYLSQPFMRNTARFYAEHFGGQVVPRNYNGPHRTLPGGQWKNVPTGFEIKAIEQ